MISNPVNLQPLEDLELHTVVTMKKMSSKSHRFEPVDTQWAKEHPQCARMLMNVGWFTFFKKITGYNVEVSQEFAKKFTSTVIDFASISFEVSRASIGEATRLSVDKDKWFKEFPFEVDMNFFLLPGHETLDWNKGIHMNVKGRMETCVKYHSTIHHL